MVLSKSAQKAFLKGLAQLANWHSHTCLIWTQKIHGLPLGLLFEILFLESPTLLSFQQTLACGSQISTDGRLTTLL